MIGWPRFGKNDLLFWALNKISTVVVEHNHLAPFQQDLTFRATEQSASESKSGRSCGPLVMKTVSSVGSERED